MRGILRSKLFRKLFARYLLILGITSILLVITTTITLFNTYNRLTENTQKFMSHMTELLDNRMIDLQKLTLFVSQNSSLLPYKLQDQVAYPHLISDELKKLKAPSTDLDSIGIYYRNSNYESINGTVFTDTGMYSVASYASLLTNNQIPADMLEETLTNVQTPTLISSLASGEGQVHYEQTLLYVVPLTVNLHSNGIVIFKLNYISFFNNFKQVVDMNSNLIILDRFQQPILYLSNDTKLPYETMFSIVTASSDEETESGQLRKETANYLFMEEISPKRQFHVVNAVRKSSYYHEFHLALLSSIGIVLLSLILGLFLSYRSAKKSYQPIVELSKSFPSFMKQNNVEEQQDELVQLSEYIDQMREESNKLSNEIYNQEVLSRNQLLQAMLMGKLNMEDTSETIRTALENYLEERKYSNVFLFLFDNYNTKISREPLNEQWLWKYIICNVFEDLSGEHGQHYALDLAIDNGIVGVVSWDSSHTADYEKIGQQLAKQVIDFMQRHYKVALSCAIGELGEASDMHTSFDSAATLAEYRVFTGQQAIITPTLVEKQKGQQRNEEKIQSSSLITNIHAAVSAKDVEKLERHILELEEGFSWLDDTTTFRMTYLQIVFSLNQFVNNIPLSYREAIKYKLELLAEYPLETITEACQQLLQVARSIQDSLGEEISDDRLYKSMLDYVVAHYTDPNLSLSMVAEHFNLTPSYVTRYFKNKNGTPLMQYVSKIRIDHAKQLLLESHLSIKEIVEQVGFVDENNFSRSFRKREGVSPSQFRSMH